MDVKSVEQKWQARWEKTKLNSFDKKETEKPKLYVLEMFSYPSGAKLHIGHWYNYGPTDSYARFKRMQGYNALWQPGTDHASISTEVKIIEALKKEGVDKHDLGREKFL